jgi:hypothetical protein
MISLLGKEFRFWLQKNDTKEKLNIGKKMEKGLSFPLMVTFIKEHGQITINMELGCNNILMEINIKVNG